MEKGNVRRGAVAIERPSYLISLWRKKETKRGEKNSKQVLFFFVTCMVKLPLKNDIQLSCRGSCLLFCREPSEYRKAVGIGMHHLASSFSYDPAYDTQSISTLDNASDCNCLHLVNFFQDFALVCFFRLSS